jgi:hypothetical protein
VKIKNNVCHLREFKKNVIPESTVKSAGTEFLILLNYGKCCSGLLTPIVDYPRRKEL